jgi:hypothetical protein
VLATHCSRRFIRETLSASPPPQGLGQGQGKSNRGYLQPQMKYDLADDQDAGLTLKPGIEARVLPNVSSVKEKPSKSPSTRR